MYFNLVKRLINHKWYDPAYGIRSKKQQFFFFGRRKMKMITLMAKGIVKEDLMLLAGHDKIPTKKECLMANLSRKRMSNEYS